jgi:hypothetical protein
VSSLITSIILSNNRKITFKELKVKDYKTILKCLIDDPIDTATLITNLNNILEEITTLSKDEILNLNLFDYFLLLLNIRMISMGRVVFAVYKAESLNIQIDLDKAINFLTDATNLNLFKTPIKKHNIKITFNIPTIKKLLEYNADTYYIDNIVINNIPANDLNKVLDLLPVEFIKPISTEIKNNLNKIEQIPFYNPPIEKYKIFFSLAPESYIYLIKIIFNENLLSVYDNIFYLGKLCNMSPEYLENITYGEFKIFVKKAEQLLQNSNRNNSNNTLTNDMDMPKVDINSLYGNDFGDEIGSTPLQPSEFTP